MVSLAVLLAASSGASAENRTLKLFFIHTQEKGEFTFKRNGKYDQAELKRLNRFLRDWRRNEPTRMDPRLFDLVWEAYRQVGGSDYIHVVSAYRSPATNSMLRSRSKGVAEKSQHMLGRAMDFYIPGVKLQKLRYTAMRLQGGGVGYYPTSGAPFVHMDVGNVRHWPRMSRQELVSVFPNGKTLHVPTDGKPLPGFEQALAAYNSRKGSGNLAAISVASNSGGGSSSSGSGKTAVGLLAAFFGGGADEEEDGSAAEEVVATASTPAPAKPAAVVAAPAAAPSPQIRVVPPELATPAMPAAEEPETIVAALPDREAPIPVQAPRPSVDVGPTTILDEAAGDVQPAGGALPAEQKTDGEVELAMRVPLPTFRPDYTPPPELATPEPQPKDAALLALLEREDSATPIDPGAPSVGALPVPEARPTTVAEGVSGFTVASLPETGPALRTQSDATIGGVRGQPVDEAALLPKGPEPGVATPTPKAAVVSETSSASVEPAVKTTAKGAKPARRSKKPEPKAVVVSAQPDAARWALDSNYVALRTAGTTAPSLAYNIVRTAPREVYTAGFGTTDQLSDANKFTGNAVTFLSVARFETN
jgi:uncharacterized protein YcbK (DUF882 family)